MEVDPEDLMGAHELGPILHVNPRTVSNWYLTRARTGFPDPIVHRSLGPLFSKKEVIEWWKNFQPANHHKRVGYLDEEGA